MAHSTAGSSAAPSKAVTPTLEEPPPQSVPMTASNSHSSLQSSKEPADKDQSKTHYGTRSRNRPSRPNYAEDVEMDFEQPVQSNGKSAKAPSPAAASTRASPTTAGAPKRAPSGTNGWASVNANQNPSIPGTSSFSANLNVPTSKKRKAAQAAGGSQGNSAQPAQAQAAPRRAVTSAGARDSRQSNMFSYDKTGARLQKGKLVADDGTEFCVNDHVYLVCEPPGDPYYLGRIMEFRCKESDDKAPVDAIRINWIYRPRDVQRLSSDTRLVYATMHSDICPLTSLRGKCTVSHKADFDDLEEYKKKPDHFYFNQAFDRFIHRWYEVIPTSQVINVPENVKAVLDARWKYIVVEAVKVKELTSNAKRCKRCSGYCATNDSVDCAVCRNTYHMNCVTPPLLKKPSRGFAWACAVCSRAQERKLEARRTPVIGGTDGEEDEIMEEEEEELPVPTTTAPSPSANDDRPATEAEIAHAKMWTMRYLGIHCRVEDALQYDDRAIYPRASSRLGPKHQANVLPWYGRPVQLVKPAEIKKKFIRTAGKKESNRMTKETLAAIEADRVAKSKRPKYIQDEPPGYVRRGEDFPRKDPQTTALPLFKMPTVGELSERGIEDKPNAPEELIDAYMERAKKVAQDIGIKEYSVDFIDRALFLLQENNYDADAAYKQLRKTDAVGKWPDNRTQLRKDLRDPALSLSADEKKRFAEGVTKYGSELRNVRIHVRTLPHADIVRFWYHWKKTAKGQEIWGSYGGRRNTKKIKAESEAAAKLVDDIADDFDDSAFDNEKIDTKSRRMICKHCQTRHSRFWRRAPGVSPGQTVPGEGRGSNKKESLVLALCDRCARLWRKYAIKWENMDEIMKKLTQVGSKAWKKKLDPELLKEIEFFNNGGGKNGQTDSADTSDAHAEPPPGEPAKKKSRLSTNDKPKEKQAPAPPPPRPPTPPLIPAMPKMKEFPCAICLSFEKQNDSLLLCRDCRLTVHRKCYGLPQSLGPIGSKWSCEMCVNDRKEGSSMTASCEYNCLLCPVHLTQRELVEPPKVSHKKKTEREKEKERIEREFANRIGESYRQQQRDRGRPQLPREALKKTVDNNWAHVACSIFVPEIKFSNSKTLAAAEGVPFALRNRQADKCVVCNTTNGAAIGCHAAGCNKMFHVMCAIQAEFKFGLDVIPVKGSRRDNVPIVTFGEETGTVNAVIWCKEHSHSVKSIVHSLNEKVDDSGTTAIEIYAQQFKQADLTLTGTMRKANQLDEYTKSTGADHHRRASTSGANKGRVIKDLSVELPEVGCKKKCSSCKIDCSPRWHKVEKHNVLPPPPHVRQDEINKHEDTPMVNGISRESSMRVESLLTNGIPSPRMDRHKENGVASSSRGILNGSSETEQLYECHQCHIRRSRPPPPQEEVPMEIEPTIESPIIVSPVPHHPPPHQWGGLSSIPPQQPTHGTWPIGGQRQPSPPPAYAPQGPPYHNQEAGYSRPHEGPYPPPHRSESHYPPEVYPGSHVMPTQYGPEPAYAPPQEMGYPPGHAAHGGPPPTHGAPPPMHHHGPPPQPQGPPHGAHHGHAPPPGPHPSSGFPGHAPQRLHTPGSYAHSQPLHAPPPMSAPPMQNGIPPSPTHGHSMHGYQQSGSPYRPSSAQPPPPNHHHMSHHHTSPVPGHHGSPAPGHQAHHGSPVPPQSHHHGSPVPVAHGPAPPHMAQPAPPAGMHVAPSSRPATQGASGSASLRNLID